MNAGMVALKDGTPCLIYDEALPGTLEAIEFNRRDFLITMVYKEDLAETIKKKKPQAPVLKDSRIARMMKPLRTGHKLEYPLDHDFVALLEKRKDIAVGFVKDGEISGVMMIPVVFTST